MHEENIVTYEMIPVLNHFIVGIGTDLVENDVDVGDGVSMELDKCCQKL